jgi:hypothetical protein
VIYTCAKCGAVVDDDWEIGTKTPEGHICEGCAAEVEEMKDKFNKYCAEIVGLIVKDNTDDGGLFVTEQHRPTFDGWFYSPYDDLNQMAKVVEKLITNAELADWLSYDISENQSIKQAFRDFILATMEDKE